MQLIKIYLTFKIFLIFFKLILFQQILKTHDIHADLIPQ